MFPRALRDFEMDLCRGRASLARPIASWRRVRRLLALIILINVRSPTVQESGHNAPSVRVSSCPVSRLCSRHASLRIEIPVKKCIIYSVEVIFLTWPCHTRSILCTKQANSRKPKLHCLAFPTYAKTAYSLADAASEASRSRGRPKAEGAAPSGP